MLWVFCFCSKAEWKSVASLSLSLSLSLSHANTPFHLLQVTIGIDFVSKTMYLEDRIVRLQLWYVSLSPLTPPLFVFLSTLFTFSPLLLFPTFTPTGIPLVKKDSAVSFPATSVTLRSPSFATTSQVRSCTSLSLSLSLSPLFHSLPSPSLTPHSPSLPPSFPPSPSPPDRASFLNSEQWIDDVRNERGSDVVIMLVGNKTDLSDRRQVTTEEGERKAKEAGVMFIETSAKAGFNVKALFKKLAMALPGMDQNNKQSEEVDVKLKSVKLNQQNVPENTQGGCAC